MRFSCSAAAAALLIGAVGSSSLAAAASAGNPTPAAPGSPTAADVLGRLVAARRGLNSYSVPIHFNLTVHKGISVSAQLEATRYFQAPDKEVLEMKSLPSIAKQFRYIYTGVGTPETWPSQYDVTFAQAQTADSKTYQLRGVPKNNPNLSYALLDVARDTFAPVAAQLYYKNGGTIALQFENAPVEGGFLLTAVETIDIAFPDYKVHAVGHYGTYSINQPIPGSVWQQNPQPLPT
jgi:hypothetical protein